MRRFAHEIGLYLQALNQMIDSQGTRLAALRNRIPDIVLVTLYLTPVFFIYMAQIQSWLKRGYAVPSSHTVEPAIVGK